MLEDDVVVDAEYPAFKFKVIELDNGNRVSIVGVTPLKLKFCEKLPELLFPVPKFPETPNPTLGKRSGFCGYSQAWATADDNDRTAT